MLPKTLKYGAVLACVILVLASLPSSADDGKGDKPALSGVWVQNKGEMQIEFAGKDRVKFLPHGGNDCTIVCQYTVDKKGLVKAKITELEGNGKAELEKVLPVGLEFSFRWTVKDDTATLEEVKGKVKKSHLEGKYRQKK